MHRPGLLRKDEIAGYAKDARRYLQIAAFIEITFNQKHNATDRSKDFDQPEKVTAAGLGGHGSSLSENRTAVGPGSTILGLYSHHPFTEGAFRRRSVWR